MSKKGSKADFWDKFQKFSCLPDIIATILKKSGYDSPVALKLLNEKNIERVEQFTFNKLSDLVEKSGYPTSDDKFEFLPGHKVLLFELPNIVENFLQTEAEQQKASKKNRAGKTLQQLDVVEVEVLSEEEKNKLKESLISKVNKYSEKIKLVDFNLLNEHVSCIDTCISKSGEIVYKCTVSCPSCKVKIPCIHNKLWQISNLEKHLRENYENERKQKEGQSINDITDDEHLHKDRVENDVDKPNLSNAADLNALIAESSVNKNSNDENNSTYIPLSESFQKSISISK